MNSDNEIINYNKLESSFIKLKCYFTLLKTKLLFIFFHLILSD